MRIKGLFNYVLIYWEFFSLEVPPKLEFFETLSDAKERMKELIEDDYVDKVIITKIMVEAEGE